MDGLHAAFIGRLGADSELKYTAGGLAPLRCSVCVKDLRAEEKGDPAQWVKVILFGESAEQLAPRLTKGIEVYVEGRVKLNRWTDREQKERADLELVAWTVQPLGQIGRRRPPPPANGQRQAHPAPAAAPDELDQVPF